MLCRIVASLGWVFLMLGVASADSELFIVPALVGITGALLLFAASKMETETEADYEQTDTEKARY